MKLTEMFKMKDGGFMIGYDSDKDCYTIHTSIQNLEIPSYDLSGLYLKLTRLKTLYLTMERDDEDSTMH